MRRWFCQPYSFIRVIIVFNHIWDTERGESSFLCLQVKVVSIIELEFSGFLSLYRKQLLMKAFIIKEVFDEIG